MNVVWICSYPLQNLRHLLSLRRPIEVRTTNWLPNLAAAFSDIDDIKLTIITTSSRVERDHILSVDGVDFQVIKSALPILGRGIPSHLDRLSLYYFIRRRVQDVIEVVNPDVIHAHGTESFFGLISMKYSRKSILSIQGIISDVYKHERTITNLMQIAIENLSIRNNRYFGCRTHYDLNHVLTLNHGGKIYHLPEVIGDCFFNIHKQCDKDKSLLFVGSLSPRKGLWILLRALLIVKSRFPDVRLHVIGDGALETRQMLDLFIRSNDLQNNVVFHGYLQASEIASLLSKVHIYVHPSLVDNSPNSLLEAMASGTACIASNIGGIPFFIKDHQTGLLYDPTNHAELAERICLLLNNVELRKHISLNAKKLVVENNTPQTVVQKYLHAYRTLVP